MSPLECSKSLTVPLRAAIHLWYPVFKDGVTHLVIEKRGEPPVEVRYSELLGHDHLPRIDITRREGSELTTVTPDNPVTLEVLSIGEVLQIELLPGLHQESFVVGA